MTFDHYLEAFCPKRASGRSCCSFQRTLSSQGDKGRLDKMRCDVTVKATIRKSKRTDLV